MAKLKRRSKYADARLIAQRLDGVGVNPYSSESEQYVVLADEREGEIIEFGRPLRAHQMFLVKTRARTEKLANEFEAFAQSVDTSSWCFWTVHRPSRKTKVDELVADLRKFNADLNNVFTQLRKHCGFELIMIGVHIGFDETTGLFDVHAHFVCAIDGFEEREDARRRLMSAFSRANLPDKKIQSAQGAARYLSRTYKLCDVVRWPIEALKAAWGLIDYKFHYTRTGRSFAAWRRDNKEMPDQHEVDEARRKRKNRAETRYQPKDRADRDTLLVTRTWQIGDEKIRGTLYRAAASLTERTSPPKTACPPSPVNSANDNLAPDGSQSYPSALVDTTQTAPTPNTSCSPLEHENSPTSPAASRPKSRWQRILQSGCSIVQSIRRWWSRWHRSTGDPSEPDG